MAIAPRKRKRERIFTEKDLNEKKEVHKFANRPSDSILNAHRSENRSEPCPRLHPH